MSELKKENLDQIVTLTRQPDENEEEIVSLTPRAINKLKEACEAEGVLYGIRIFVQGGGCAGYTYGLDFEKQGRDSDRIFEQDGVKVYIDPISAMQLEGVILDYVMGLSGTGFKFNNPSKTTCGCGSSFG